MQCKRSEVLELRIVGKGEQRILQRLRRECGQGSCCLRLFFPIIAMQLAHERIERVWIKTGALIDADVQLGLDVQFGTVWAEKLYFSFIVWQPPSCAIVAIP